MDGWKCPVCGRGVAPSEKHCDHGGSLAQPYFPGMFPSVMPTVPWRIPTSGDPVPDPGYWIAGNDLSYATRMGGVQ